jgi:hypothetical protein
MQAVIVQRPGLNDIFQHDYSKGAIDLSCASALARCQSSITTSKKRGLFRQKQALATHNHHRCFLPSVFSRAVLPPEGAHRYRVVGGLRVALSPHALVFFA